MNWEAMEQIWQHTYENELVVDPTEHPIMLTEPPSNAKADRVKLMEIFFENFNVNHFNLSVQAVLALYASGRTTGIIVDSGDGVTHTVPVYEGFALPFATMKMELAGRDLTNYLQRLLSDRGFDFSNSNDREECEKIKEKKCTIAYDFDAAVKESQEPNPKEVVYSLPDGSNISLTNEHFKCPEALFQPNKLGKDFPGIHELTYQSILRCEIHIRRDLYGNVILAGGSTMFQGINNRLFKEISALAPSTMKIKVKTPQERRFSVWIGGSILSSLKAFESIWITAAEYKESGDNSIVHKKCF